MATLVLVNRPNADQHFPLGETPLVIGRNPDCAIVLASPAVSREHARVFRKGDQCYVQDLRSQNKTYVNNKEVVPDRPAPLHHCDRVRICDCWFIFYDGPPPDVVVQNDESDEEDSSTIISFVDSDSPNSQRIIESQPAVRLKILLELTNQLSGTLEPDSVLPTVLDTLIRIYPQAEYGFYIERDEDRQLHRKIAKARRPLDPTHSRFSRSIVHQCLDTGQALLIENAQTGKTFVVTDSIAANKICSSILAPLRSADGVLFGVMQLYTQNEGKRFTLEDLELLVAVCNQTGLALDNARLHKQTVEMERRLNDLKTAADVQKSFLPLKLPTVAGYHFFAHYRPAREVGGDLYSFIPLPNERLAIAIGDVAGKGMPAALLMARVISEIRYAITAAQDPGAALAHLNDLLKESPTDQFVTFLLMILDTLDHHLTIVNAGHLPVVVRRHAGKIEEHPSSNDTGLPLGIVGEASYTSCRIPLHPGDCAVLCTDGILEASNPKGELFGLGRIRSTIAAAPLTPEDIGGRLLQAVAQHSAGVAEQHDDITLVCLGRLK
jgi:serine phosphatase RsbU (regulator of sigma subunit)